jgi:predicted CXXCH cytochrome family protein
MRGGLLALVLTLLIALLGLLFNSCGTMPRAIHVPPEVPGASFAGDRACMECHTAQFKTFSLSPHGRLHVRDARLTGQGGCESCHGPGSLHIQSSGGRKFIVNPRKDATACLQCHLETHAEFKLPHHHPVLEGRMNCVECHDPHGVDIAKPARGLAMSRQNESCAQCHREQSKPFVFEHEAMREGCTTCHNPHGSVNDKLLIERDNNLCFKCHAQQPGTLLPAGQVFIGRVNHTDRLRQGGCWTAGCHTAVHGSDFNPRQLY